MYDYDAIFYVRPEEVLKGSEQIRAALEESVTLKPVLKVHSRKILEADGIALVTGEWTLTGTQPDGSVVEMGGSATDVLRRQPEGDWRFLIDNPWGTDVVI